MAGRILEWLDNLFSSMTKPGPSGNGTNIKRADFYRELVHQLIAVSGLVLSLHMCLKYLDPYREQRQQAKKRAAFLKQHLGRSVQLNEYEQLLASNVMNPERIDVTLEDVSGLDHIIKEMELKVIAPMLRPDIYSTTLWRQTKGVLFYGPPGTGKTMLAKALAKGSRCFFLNVTASSIMSKWLGDANRLIRAVFTLAEKLQPCIIFIDEVDAMLGKRASQEHEAVLQAKTEFMQLWDGMESSTGHRIVVMGATNRPWMVDEAVLRRFSLQYELGLPNREQRFRIVRGYLMKHQKEVSGHLGAVADELLHNRPVPGGGSGGALDWVADHTQGFSGSDLMELCSQAAQRVLSEYMEQHEDEAFHGHGGALLHQLRPMCLKDFQAVLKHVRPSTAKADDYREVYTQQGSNGGEMGELVRVMKLMRSFGLLGSTGGGPGTPSAPTPSGAAPPNPPSSSTSSNPSGLAGAHLPRRDAAQHSTAHTDPTPDSPSENGFTEVQDSGEEYRQWASNGENGLVHDP